RLPPPAFDAAHRSNPEAPTRRALRAKFQAGKLVPPLIAGYQATAHPQTEQDVWANPQATPVAEEVARRLKGGVSDAAVARYLNDIGFATGPRCRKTKWHGRMVRRWITSPLIGGVHVHGQWRRVLDRRTGRVRQVKAAPHEVHTRDCPHLRHLPREEHEALVRWLEQRR
ncbi:MAG: recombinase family protein, partial [bacterium]